MSNNYTINLSSTLFSNRRQKLEQGWCTFTVAFSIISSLIKVLYLCPACAGIGIQYCVLTSKIAVRCSAYCSGPLANKAVNSTSFRVGVEAAIELYSRVLIDRRDRNHNKPKIWQIWLVEYSQNTMKHHLLLVLELSLNPQVCHSKWQTHVTAVPIVFPYLVERRLNRYASKQTLHLTKKVKIISPKELHPKGQWALLLFYSALLWNVKNNKRWFKINSRKPENQEWELSVAEIGRCKQRSVF
jgi:hypothetical protein